MACNICGAAFLCQHTVARAQAEFPPVGRIEFAQHPPSAAAELNSGRTVEARMLTEADVRRIVREELAAAQRPQRFG